MEYAEKIHNKLLSVESRIKNKGRLEREMESMASSFKKKGKISYDFIVKYFIEHEYPLLKKEKIEAKNEWLKKGMENYRNYVAEYSGKDLEMLELEKRDMK